MEGLVAELIDCAEANFRLDKPDDKGLTARQRYTIEERAGRVLAADWHPKPPPVLLQHLWLQFLELHRWRGVYYKLKPTKTQEGQFAWATEYEPRPLDLIMVLNWAEAYSHEVTPFHMRIFEELDAAFWRVYWNKNSSGDPVNVADVIKRGLRSLASAPAKSSMIRIVDGKVVGNGST